MESISNFVHMENAKTKINTIAAEHLGITSAIPDHVMNELVEQVLTFLNEVQELSESENPDMLFILSDLFVATMITTAMTVEKLKETVQAYDQLLEAYTKLKEKHES